MSVPTPHIIGWLMLLASFIFTECYLLRPNETITASDLDARLGTVRRIALQAPPDYYLTADCLISFPTSPNGQCTPTRFVFNRQALCGNLRFTAHSAWPDTRLEIASQRVRAGNGFYCVVKSEPIPQRIPFGMGIQRQPLPQNTASATSVANSQSFIPNQSSLTSSQASGLYSQQTGALGALSPSWAQSTGTLQGASLPAQQVGALPQNGLTQSQPNYPYQPGAPLTSQITYPPQNAFGQTQASTLSSQQTDYLTNLYHSLAQPNANPQGALSLQNAAYPQASALDPNALNNPLNIQVPQSNPLGSGIIPQTPQTSALDPNALNNALNNAALQGAQLNPTVGSITPQTTPTDVQSLNPVSSNPNLPGTLTQ